MDGKESASGTAVTPERGSSIKAILRNRLTAGLVLIVPVWITVVLVGFVFRLMRDSSFWMVEALLRNPWVAAALERLGASPEALRVGEIDALPAALRWGLAGVSVLLTVAVIYVMGMITTNIVGRRIVRYAEGLVDRLPLIKTVYHASKQVLATFAGEAAQSFQRVVSVPFPNSQVRTVGFVTQVTRDPSTGEEMCAVFMATAPNPTTGFVFFVRRSDLIELNWTVEQAVKVIMSGGVLLPEGGLPAAPASAGGGRGGLPGAIDPSARVPLTRP